MRLLEEVDDGVAGGGGGVGVGRGGGFVGGRGTGARGGFGGEGVGSFDVFFGRTEVVLVRRRCDRDTIDFIRAGDVGWVIAGELVRNGKGQDNGDESAAEPGRHVPGDGVDGVAGG